MNISDVNCGERGFTVSWDDQSVAEFPFIWLRDNDPDELHPATRERIFDLTSIELGISPERYALDANALVVAWPEKEQPSIYPAGWLNEHRPGRRRGDPAHVERTYWDQQSMTNIPRVDARACVDETAILRDALLTLKRYGILLVGGLDDSPDASQSIGNLIGFRRRTNFGDMFEVVSKPQPNNLAYTSMALPLHTDLPNQEIIPGYQFLHSYRNTANGGESIFADGFQVCADLREEVPDDFELLQRIAVPWRFHDDDHDIRQRRPVISLGEDGNFDYFVFNAHIADLPDLDADLLYDFYGAYQRLMIRLRGPKYTIRHALAPGEMVVFDNARVLHGRAAFDAQSGDRHYRGFYIERNEVDSRIRVLSRDV